VKYYEEHDTDNEERPKFDNLEVYYEDSSAYNITRIRVCKDYNNILDDFRTQIQESCKEAESNGDTLKVGLCQDALD